MTNLLDQHLETPLTLQEQALPKAGGKETHILAQRRINRTLSRQNRKGFEKYGRHLNVFNGRNIVRDLEEEMADQINYFEVMTQEYIWMRKLLNHLYSDLPAVEEYLNTTCSEAELDFIRFVPKAFYDNDFGS